MGIIVASVALAFVGQDGPVAVSEVLKIVRNLSIKRSEIERAFGQPFAVKKNSDSELASYKAKGATAVSIYYFARGAGRPMDTPFPIEVSFPKGTTGQAAIKLLGFDPGKVTLGKARADMQGDRFVLGHGIKGFDVYWIEAGAKYPDGTPKNSVNGDALVLFDIKSE